MALSDADKRKSSALLGVGESIACDFERLLAGGTYKQNEAARYAGCLCLTIAEAFRATLALLRSPVPTHAPTMVRAMLEALADLKNLVADPAYIDQMRFSNAEQQLKTFKAFRDDPDMKNDKDMQNEVGHWIAIEQRIYDARYTKERNDFNVYKKFKRADLLDLYRTSYSFLCSFAHSDVNTLNARHGKEGPLLFAEPLPAETLQSILGLAVSIYGMALKTLPAYSTLTNDAVHAACDEADSDWAAVA